MKKINKVCVVGAGYAGLSVALRMALHDIDVAIYDKAEVVLKSIPKRALEASEEITRRSKGKPISNDVEKALQRIHICKDAATAAAGADLLSENVTEILSVKREVFAQFDKLCPAETIFTTNTNSLLVSELASAIKRSEKMVAMHFHEYFSFVEIMGSAQTSPEIIADIQRLCQRLHEVPITLHKENNGYVHDVFWREWRKMAIILLLEGISDIEDIDRTEMLFHNATPGYGPFGTFDRTGVDIAYQVNQARMDKMPSEETKKILDFLRPYVEKGEIGKKSGKGFYSYPNPAFERPGFLEGK